MEADTEAEAEVQVQEGECDIESYICSESSKRAKWRAVAPGGAVIQFRIEIIANNNWI